MNSTAEDNSAIRNRFDPQTIKYIISGITQGYTMASNLSMQVPWIYQTIRGKAKLPHLRNVAIEVMLLELAKLGEIPLIGTEAWNERKTHSFITLKSVDCVMTVNYVHRPTQFPRRALFREYLSENNIQQALWPEYQEPDKSNILYTVLTHGGDQNNLLFASIGAPLPGCMKWGTRLPIFHWSDIREVDKVDDSMQKIAKKPALKKLILERLSTGEGDEE